MNCGHSQSRERSAAMKEMTDVERRPRCGLVEKQLVHSPREIDEQWDWGETKHSEMSAEILSLKGPPHKAARMLSTQ